MKLLAVLIAAGMFLPCLAPKAEAGHRRHAVVHRSYAVPYSHHYGNYHRYRPYAYRYSHRPSLGVSVSFGRSYCPSYYRPSYRVGACGRSFGVSIGRGYGYWGY